MCILSIHCLGYSYPFSHTYRTEEKRTPTHDFLLQQKCRFNRKEFLKGTSSLLLSFTHRNTETEKSALSTSRTGWVTRWELLTPMPTHSFLVTIVFCSISKLCTCFLLVHYLNFFSSYVNISQNLLLSKSPLHLPTTFPFFQLFHGRLSLFLLYSLIFCTSVAT